MEANQVSSTARISAFVRALHAAHDTPKIFDDFLAPQMFTEEERALFRENLSMALAFFDPEHAAISPDQATALHWFTRAQSGPIVLSRARYTEDGLEAAVKEGVRQYVILGAGLDTFAFRRPDLLKQIQVFEIDHPATQEFKRRRLAELGWELPPQLNFIPVDFNDSSLTTALEQSAYDPQVLSFFSWLGVTYYLTREVVLGTLGSIAGIAPTGSPIIFDYLDTDAFVPEKAAKRVQLMQEAARRGGEPMKGGLDPLALPAELAKVGLRLLEDLQPADIQARYFDGRTDGYYAFEHVHLAWAVVA
ncbi:MAG TPA: class I SAM-dependent methyltransferase [Anaerolineae bacterium]